MVVPFAGAVSGHAGLPAEVARAHVGWTVELAYQNVASEWTLRLTAPGGRRRYLKFALVDSYPSLADERERTEWVARYLPAPRIVGSGEEAGRAWLLTEELRGLDATRVARANPPVTLVQTLARALRRFHDTLPVETCPFDFRLDRALEHVTRRVEAGVVDAATDFHDEFAHHSPATALEKLRATRPSSEALVVCHGDYCAPNIVLTADGEESFLDLGEVGVADRWWDLAIATWSVGWNYGPGLEGTFLDAYGIEPDPARTVYYRLLYDLVS